MQFKGIFLYSFGMLLPIASELRQTGLGFYLYLLISIRREEKSMNKERKDSALL